MATRVADGEEGLALRQELDDVLSDGYAAALALDGRRAGLERQLTEAADADLATRRALAAERRAAADEAARLRAQLRPLFDALSRLDNRRFPRRR